MLRQHSADLATFLSTDPRGQQLPTYFQALAQQMGEEQAALLKEMRSLNDGIEHIKSIISMQQQHARTVGAVEQVMVPQIIDEALRLHISALEKMASSSSGTTPMSLPSSLTGTSCFRSSSTC
jgi:two-component system sensor kinase FixL